MIDLIIGFLVGSLSSLIVLTGAYIVYTSNDKEDSNAD